MEKTIKYNNNKIINKNFINRSIFFAILLITPFTLVNTKFIIVLLILTFIYAIAAIGLNILMGFAGQISIGHAAFMAIGAYSSALLTYHLKIGFIPAFLISGFIAGIFGLVLGLPALRLKGFYLAITTMGFGIATTQILSSWESLTKGHSGLTQDIIQGFDLFGYKVEGDIANYLVVIIIFFIIYLISKNLENSKYGRNFKALRDSEIAALTSGINTTYYKLLAFIISSVFAGFAGSLYAHVLRYLNPINFDLDLSLNLLAMIIIGGIANIEGSILGAFFLTILSQMFTRMNFPPSILNGTAIIIVMLFLPQGLISLYYKYKIKINKESNKEIIPKLKNGIENFVKIDNLNIHYLKKGNGPQNIFFIHGNTGSARWWIKLLNRLDNSKYTLWAITLPGFGDSGRLNLKPEQITIDVYSDYVYKFIKHFNLNNIVLLGHSLGGVISQLFLLKHTSLVSKLVLVDSGPPEGIKTPDSFLPSVKSLINNRSLMKRSMKTSILKYNNQKFLNFAVSEALKMQDILFTGNVFALNKFNLKEFIKINNIDISKINVPILSIKGKYDIVINDEMFQSINNFYDNVVSIIFDISSHSPFIEETNIFKNILEKFIG